MVTRSSYRGHAITVVLVAGFAGCAGGHEGGPPERTGEARSAISYGTESPATDDFIVLLQQRSDATAYLCSGVVVAPNLIVTAKHCLYPQTDLKADASQCGPNGEAVLGTDGFLEGQPTPADVLVYVGANAKERAVNLGEPPVATGTRVVDDGSPMRCSYDIAYVVLDKPLETPIARLRLDKRPAPGDKISVAGWGEIEGRIRPAFRQRRDDVIVQRVGPKEVPPQPVGDLGPMIFETSAGGCIGDSGGPAFEPATGVALGILSRGLFLDRECRSQSAVNVYVALGDHEKTLRDAFAAADAQPWLEGRDTPGYRAFGDACGSNAECAGNLCVGASVTAKGTCNVDCRAGRACPTDLVCSPRGKCEPPEEDLAKNELRASGCTAGADRAGDTTTWSSAVAALMFVCRFRKRRSTMRSRSGRNPCS